MKSFIYAYEKLKECKRSLKSAQDTYDHELNLIATTTRDVNFVITEDTIYEINPRSQKDVVKEHLIDLLWDYRDDTNG